MTFYGLITTVEVQQQIISNYPLTKLIFEYHLLWIECLFTHLNHAGSTRTIQFKNSSTTRFMFRAKEIDTFRPGTIFDNKWPCRRGGGGEGRGLGNNATHLGTQTKVTIMFAHALKPFFNKSNKLVILISILSAASLQSGVAESYLKLQEERNKKA